MNTGADAYKYSKEETKLPYHIHLHKRAKIIRIQEDTTSCPHCHNETTTDHHRAETYCTECGLVVSATIDYVGLRRIHYEYGKK